MKNVRCKYERKELFKPYRQNFGIELICHVMCILTSFSILIGFNNMMTRFFTLIINCVIYYSLIFAKVRQEGERDRNRVNTGHMHSSPYKGLIAALIASSPLIILSILLIIAKSDLYQVNFRLGSDL